LNVKTWVWFAVPFNKKYIKYNNNSEELTNG